MLKNHALIWSCVLALLILGGVLEAYDLSTPESTFQEWFHMLSARADWRDCLMFYSPELTERMRTQAADGVGHHNIHGYHLALDEHFGNRRFVPDKVDIQDDRAVLVAKAPDGETMTFELVNVYGEWKIDKLPPIPGGEVLSGKSLAILAVVLLVVVIVVAKKFLIP